MGRTDFEAQFGLATTIGTFSKAQQALLKERANESNETAVAAIKQHWGNAFPLRFKQKGTQTMLTKGSSIVKRHKELLEHNVEPPADVLASIIT